MNIEHERFCTVAPLQAEFIYANARKALDFDLNFQLRDITPTRLSLKSYEYFRH